MHKFLGPGEAETAEGCGRCASARGAGPGLPDRHGGVDALVRKEGKWSPDPQDGDSRWALYAADMAQVWKRARGRGPDRAWEWWCPRANTEKGVRCGSWGKANVCEGPSDVRRGVCDPEVPRGSCLRIIYLALGESVIFHKVGGRQD